MGTTAAKELDISVIESFAEPEPHKVRKTLLRSAHVKKKHRVQYEFRTYYHTMKFGKLTESTAITFLEYIQRNLPEGMAMKVTKHERKKLPEIIEEHINETISKASANVSAPEPVSAPDSAPAFASTLASESAPEEKEIIDTASVINNEKEAVDT